MSSLLPRYRALASVVSSLLLLVVMLAVTVQPVEAATITVCASGCDSTTIEGALFTALTNGDTDDTIQISAGTYTLPSTLFVNDANTTLSFVGADPATTIIQADAVPQTAAFNVFTIGGTANKTTNISNVTIRHGNRAGAGQFGGGIEIASGNTVNLNNVIISDNRAAFGGGIYNAGTLTVVDSRIENNAATNNGGGGDGAGGGVYNGAATTTISNSVLIDNTAVFGGGGIRNFTGGTMTVTNSVLETNSTDTVGGAVHSNGDLIIVGSSLIENTALLNGGALNNEFGGVISITNSTIATNTVRTVGASAGGAISNENEVTAAFTTFYQNSSAFSGDTFANAGATDNIAVTDSIIVANPSGSGFTCNFTGNINGTNNLSTNNTGCSSLDSLGSPTGVAPLGNNGGTTATIALQNDSNAIDLASACPASGTDQRGEARDDLACDIGAFELVYSDSDTVVRTDGNTPDEIPGSFGPTRLSITAVNSGSPGTVTVTKINAPPGGFPAGTDELPVTWDVTAAGGPYDLTVLFCYTDAELGALAPNESGLLAYRWDGASWQVQTSTVDTVNNCVEAQNVTAFSEWALATNTPTAVTLSHTATQPAPTTAPWSLIALLTLITAVGLARFNIKRRQTIRQRAD